MSSTTGFRPAASARPWRSCTLSLRDAAISTSTSPTEVGLGPITQKSRLTSSSENGMYWLASDSTCSSSSSSRRPAGSMIFLVMTADCGIAITTCLVRVPLLRDHALDRLGDLVELLDLAVGDPALLEAFGCRSARARTRRCRVCAELDQLDARRADVQADHRRVLAAQQRVKKAHDGPLVQRAQNERAGLLISYFNASSKALVHQSKNPVRRLAARCKSHDAAAALPQSATARIRTASIAVHASGRPLHTPRGVSNGTAFYNARAPSAQSACERIR